VAFPFASMHQARVTNMQRDDVLQPLIPLYADETLEDLQRRGFRMLQKKDGFRFGLDSVLLAAFSSAFCQSEPDRNIRIADLGAGAGAVSLLLAARLPGAHLSALELDPASVDVLKRNCRLNHLDERLLVVHGDIRVLAAGTLKDPSLPAGCFDIVVSNPPYRLPGRSWQPSGHLTSGKLLYRQATEETSMSFLELIAAARHLLKPHGRLVLVHQVIRLPEILADLSQNSLEPKQLRFVQTMPDRSPEIFLLSAIFQGKPGGFRAEAPLIVFERQGVYSQEAASLYGLEKPLTKHELFQGLRVMAEPADRADLEYTCE
jgi:tRNA1Val (adenine37-N6)-methyltransferase